MEEYALIYQTFAHRLSPLEVDQHAPWMLAAAYLSRDQIPSSAAGKAKKRYEDKRKAEAGTMQKRLAALAEMGRVSNQPAMPKGMTVEKPGGQRSRSRRK